jgi:lysophospholipase L1-like esterase
MSGRSRRRGVAMRVAALAGGTIVALLLAEAGLRLAGYDRTYVNPQASFHQPDPRFGYIGKPNFCGRFHSPEFNVVIEHNALGFRRHVNGGTGSADRRSLFVLGDSFTWGWGVGQGKVFTDLVAKRLGNEWDVHNFGLSATGTVQHAAIFDAYIREKLQPEDVVLLAFFSNDIPDNLSAPLRGVVRDGEVKIVGPEIEPGRPVKTWLKEYCLSFNLASFVIDRAIHKRNREKEEEIWRNAPRYDYEQTIPKESAEYIVMREALRRLKRDCENRKARFVVAFIPGHAEVDGALPIDTGSIRGQTACRQAFFACAGELELETIDLLPYFQQAKHSGQIGRTTFERDMHWNELGHAIAAEAIAGRLAKSFANRGALPANTVARQMDRNPRRE